MIELPEPKCYTHISWLKAPSGCIVTEPHASFPISLYTADQLRTYGDQRAAEAREQMREECVKELQGMTTNNATARSAIKQCAEALKELK